MSSTQHQPGGVSQPGVLDLTESDQVFDVILNRSSERVHSRVDRLPREQG